MKVKINYKWFEGRFNDERKLIIPLSKEEDILFFYKWGKKAVVLNAPKSTYVKDIEYKQICEFGILKNCYPVLNLNEDAVWLCFDSCQMIESYE